MNTNNLNEDKIRELFAQTDNASASSTAKEQAISAAMTAFEQSASGQEKLEKQSAYQGLRHLFRLTLKPKATKGETMDTTQTTTTNRFAFSGLAATACMICMGIFIGLLVNNQEQNIPVTTDKKIADVWQPAPASPLARPEERTNLDEFLEVIEQSKIAESKNRAAREMNFKRTPNTDTSRALLSAPPAAQTLEVIASPPLSAEQGHDRFKHVLDSPIKLVSEEPVSTFSIDVDTASYSFVRRQLNHGVLPQKDAVRIEEMLNYFDYNYPLPKNKAQPFSVSLAVADAPWSQPVGSANKLVHIGIKGYELPNNAAPKTNLVFLLDVSGSMSSPDKLPLVKQSMSLLLNQLKPEDTIGIVVYAGAAGTVLEPTQVKEKQKILSALQRLNAGGSTAGAQGIKLAYQLAESNFDPNAVNRIILATDGDFNVGITNQNELKGFIERKRDKGIFLSVLGFGQGNYNDHLMQTLAQNGNGVAAYIDTLSEAQKILVNEATSTLFTIAKDVKIQVEFNPFTVSEYRLLGYETRKLNREDFKNDAVDAGDIGSGHTVTAIYEITPVGSDSGLFGSSRYLQTEKSANKQSNEYGFIKVRYKLPEEDKSRLISQSIPIQGETTIPNQETNFALAVSGVAQLLKGGKHTGNWSYDDAITLAQANKGDDLYGYRTEFIQLIRKAKIADEM